MTQRSSKRRTMIPVRDVIAATNKLPVVKQIAVVRELARNHPRIVKDPAFTKFIADNTRVFLGVGVRRGWGHRKAAAHRTKKPDSTKG